MREVLAWLALGVLAMLVLWWWYAVDYFLIPFFPEAEGIEYDLPE